jgi:transcriptional regulator with GAF, ATPase, and Fis domain
MAKIRILDGPDKGSVFQLTEEVTTLGRHRDNTIMLRDKAASRFHAQISRRGDRYYVRDRESTHGTYVNKVRRDEEAPLRDNDVVHVGNTDLVFIADESAPPAPGNRDAPEPEEQSVTTLEEGTIAFSLPSAAGPTRRELSTHHLGMLSRVAEAVQSVYDLKDLLASLLDVLFEVFHPDRGVILLRREPDGSLMARVSRPSEEEFTISHTIVDYAVRNRMAVLVADTAGDERFSEAKSIKAMSIQAAICCPLLYQERILGALYLDTQVNLLTYQEEDLALLNIIAANASIAIENAILAEERREAQRLAEDEPGPIIAHSAAMSEVRRRIADLVRATSPILITGEPGTGKLFAAKTVHKSSGNHDAPFIAVDCTTVSAGEASQVLFGSAETEGAFAFASSAASAAPRARGALRFAQGGTLVLRRVDALDRASQERLLEHFEDLGKEEQTSPRVRFIATTSRDLASLVDAEGFLAPLAKKMSSNALGMPPMRERKEDILPLSALFLAKSARKTRDGERWLNQSAEHALLRLEYRHRNAAELREAIEFASLIAEEAEVGAEHIFTGPTDKGYRIEFDLEQIPLVRWLAHSPAIRVLQAAALLLFAGIIALCFAASDSTAGFFANALVWGLWWPALMALFFFLGRLWCPLCPISTMGRLAQKVWSLRRKPPKWMKKQTGWLMAFLFLAVIWSEYVFQMPQKPFATGMLLATFTACSVAFCVVHQREVWCRYLCPLGSLAASYSVPSMVHVHANPSICASQCETHDCFKGSEDAEGCPMFHHPLFIRDSHFCKLCLTCLRACKHRSVRPYLRPFLQDTWRLADLSATLAPFALTAFFLSIVMFASGKAVWGTDGPVGFTMAAALAFGMAVALNAVLPHLLSQDRNATLAARVAFALLILAWGPFMAFHLANVPGLDAIGVYAAQGSFWAQHLPVDKVTLLALIQFGSVLASALFAALTLWRIRAHFAKAGGRLPPWGWIVVLAICVAYLSAGVVLVIL